MKISNRALRLLKEVASRENGRTPGYAPRKSQVKTAERLEWQGFLVRWQTVGGYRFFITSKAENLL